MKLKNIFGLLAVSSIALFSCNDEKKDTTTTTLEETTPPVATDTVVKTTKTASMVVVTDAEVPAPIKTTFTKKYPKAEKIEWTRYVPVEEDYYFIPDTTYYYVRYNANGSDYTTWYNSLGDWIKTSTPIIGGSDKLPAAVNKMLAADYAGYEIDEVSKENDKNMEMYEVKLRKGDDKVKLKVLPNGEIAKKK